MKYVLLQLGRLWVFRRGTQNLRCCTNRCVTLNLKNQKKLLFEYLNVFCAYWVIYLFLFAFQTLKQKVKKYISIWSNHNKFIYLNIKLNDSIQNYQAKQFSMTFDKRTLIQKLKLSLICNISFVALVFQMLFIENVTVY